MKETKYISYEEPINGRSFTINQLHEVYRDLANKNIQILTVGLPIC